MEYVEITIKVPSGYENRVREVAEAKVKSILSQLILSPTQEKINEFNEEIIKSKNLIKIK